MGSVEHGPGPTLVTLCCGTVTIWCGFGSDIGKVSVPFRIPDPVRDRNPEPDPDHI
jgi:hypothetical protein